MFAIRRILHATDFSAASSSALRVACSLAKDYGAELALLHVWEPLIVMGGEGYPQVPPNSIEESMAKLDAVQVSEPSIKLVRHVVIGYPVEEIAQEAKESGCDL